MELCRAHPRCRASGRSPGTHVSRGRAATHRRREWLASLGARNAIHGPACHRGSQGTSRSICSPRDRGHGRGRHHRDRIAPRRSRVPRRRCADRGSHPLLGGRQHFVQVSRGPRCVGDRNSEGTRGWHGCCCGCGRAWPVVAGSPRPRATPRHGWLGVRDEPSLLLASAADDWCCSDRFRVLCGTAHRCHGRATPGNSLARVATAGSGGARAHRPLAARTRASRSCARP